MTPLLSIIISFFVGILSNIASAGLTHWFRRWRNVDDNALPPVAPTTQIPNLSKLIDRALESQNPKVVINIHEERRTAPASTSESSNNEWVFLFLLLILAAVLAGFWNENKVIIFWFILIISLFGWYTTFDYFQVLNRLPGMPRLRDKILAWSSTVVWVVAVAGLYLGVYRPVFPLRSFLDPGIQMMGAVLIFIVLIALIIFQLGIGNIYFKLLHGRLPNAVERFTWNELERILPFGLIILLLGFVMVSGLMFGLFGGTS